MANFRYLVTASVFQCETRMEAASARAPDQWPHGAMAARLILCAPC